jgi:hypothetical protein
MGKKWDVQEVNALILQQTMDASSRANGVWA